MSRYSTPLRYPGGKQRLAPFIAEILKANAAAGWNYAEPYAGGAGVAIELLLRGAVGRIYLTDSSRPIYAFWKAMLTDPEGLCRRIARASLTLDAWRKHREIVRNHLDHDIADVGFSTFILNRCNHSGVLTAGVIGGVEQQGEWRVDAGFPRNELIKRIEVIADLSSKISVFNMDAEAFIEKKVNALPATTIAYCDPPYLTRAKRLYLIPIKPTTTRGSLGPFKPNLSDTGSCRTTRMPKFTRFTRSGAGSPTTCNTARSRLTKGERFLSFRIASSCRRPQRWRMWPVG